MDTLFDFDRFNFSLGTIFAKSNDFTFEECFRQLDDLRLQYLNVRDTEVQVIIDREVDRMMLRIVIDKGQPFAVVSECFWRNVQRGFNSTWAEVYSTLEYADYCRIKEHLAEGARVLLDVRQRIETTTDNITEELKRDLLVEIDRTCSRMKMRTSKDAHHTQEK